MSRIDSPRLLGGNDRRLESLFCGDELCGFGFDPSQVFLCHGESKCRHPNRVNGDSSRKLDGRTGETFTKLDGVRVSKIVTQRKDRTLRQKPTLTIVVRVPAAGCGFTGVVGRGKTTPMAGTAVDAAENAPDEFVWLTKEQGAARLQISMDTLERGMKSGTLRFIGGGPGVKVRFRPEWLDDWYTRRGRGRG